MDYRTVIFICLILGVSFPGTLSDGIAESLGGSVGRVLDGLNPFSHNRRNNPGGYGGRNDNILPLDTKSGYGGNRAGYGDSLSNDRVSQFVEGSQTTGSQIFDRQTGQAGQVRRIQENYIQEGQTGQTGYVRQVEQYRDEVTGAARGAAGGVSDLAGEQRQSSQGGASAGGGGGAGVGFGGSFAGIPFGAHKEVEGGVSDSGFGAREHYGANIGGIGFEVDKNIGAGITKDGLGFGGEGGMGFGSAKGGSGGNAAIGGAIEAGLAAQKQMAGAVAQGAEAIASKAGYAH